MSGIRGWCPGALRPMESGDGLVVRIRPRGGRLTRAQAETIADAAEAWGNGTIELTGRANLQLRGVTQATHAPLLDALSQADLLDPDPATEQLRNIVVTPFATPATDRLAADVARALTDSRLPLPAKFGIAIDDAQPVLTDAPADIRVEGDLIRADGMPLAAPLRGPDDVVAMARWFLDQGGAPGGRGRMAALIAAGIRPAADTPARPPVARPAPGATPAGMLAGFEFGQIPPETLRRLSRLAPLRMTPWRMIMVCAARSLPPMPGLILRPDDPLLRTHACPGAPACASAHAPVRQLARDLAPLMPQGAVLHVSGCAKGCACPRPADLTLTATPQGFDVIRHGRASDPAGLRGLHPDQLTKVP
ncbi:precorrin-3B synthase [Paracoccus zeaxanthinifaciens]|uniref:precorrin-3B synthase n=1 Tax=Paracoccus zeaxanthinifaciens TaxID=187400 RepID=UPI0003B74102|nr:precorrin-3B synthase [Paracoccus zeaxanthinifaciens]